MPPAPQQIVLLRGINVGKAKRVAMPDLRALLERAGFAEVRTLLQSGNVVLAAKGAPKTLATRMEKAFLAAVGFSSRFTVFPRAELDAMIDANPLKDAVAEPSRFLVAILADASYRAKLEPLTKESWGADAFALGDRVAYLWCRGGMLESKLPEAVARIAGENVTTRNWGTVTKLQALAHTPR